MADGELDLGFGTDGRVTTDFGGADGARDIVIRSDGTIVAVGYGGRGDFAMARYTDDGVLDDSFGTDGRVTADFADGMDAAYAVAILPGDGDNPGGIAVAGSAGFNRTDFGVARCAARGLYRFHRVDDARRALQRGQFSLDHHRCGACAGVHDALGDVAFEELVVGAQPCQVWVI